MNISKYIIFIIELIQQQILHHKKLNDLKIMNNSNIIQEFNKFMNAFLSEKNAINKKIVKSLDLSDD